MGRKHLYNVAKLAYEWSSLIERPQGLVAGESAPLRDLMRHRRLTAESLADGGAHGPAHGSPSIVRARIVRSDKNRPTESDRGLCSPCADDTAHTPVAETPLPGAVIQSDDGSGGPGS